MAEQETRRPFSSQDVLRLFDLLERLYQGKKAPRDKVSVAVWREVLKPWSYGTVRDAVIRRARDNRFFPDPSEIAEYCGPAPMIPKADTSFVDDMERMIRAIAEMEKGETRKRVTVTVEMTFVKNEKDCTKERMEQLLRGYGNAKAVRVIDLTTEEAEADGQGERPLQNAVLHGV